ncbi:hypothetical protein H257_15575 [Aphanomyces astaci]|uniref:Uncharacterized protein n=3 Tax=Aphanomyces astaci TaxID=112090 RepID=W4FNZ3_APHAT|nr:hypothetical protein H257_15575 [Aphanomyces astaci]ETV68403.1 hypothetical protein H257_15575 [Aphanomyces astaci]|eukprot:XP_009842030.1 hypothetical protein H257_15575 [Aphanomyces astaci]
MASGNATVKAVISGDTVVLVGAASSNGPPPEIMLTLSSLQAPKLARTAEQTDEPYAFASREFLRKLLIGKPVRFKVDYRVSVINRDFGSVYLNGENVGLAVAREGFAKVKSIEQSRDGASPDHDELLRLEQVAQSEKKGIYSDDSVTAALRVNWNGLSSDELLGRFKGQQIPAIVEVVRDGASMRVILLKTMQIINFALSGVQCPRINPPVGSEQTGPAPYAKEAKLFTEVRLLHRQVHVKLEGVDKFGNMFGSVVHPSGHNISIELLKEGLGKMTDWSSEFTSVAIRTDMRNAEKLAKLNKIRVWVNYVAPVLQAAESRLTGLVVEVVSGDCLVVALKPSNNEMRLYLSSIRAPRLGNARREEPNAPYAVDAKEALRNKCIGRVVSIEVEYERNNAQNDAAALLTFASVFLEPTAAAAGKKKADAAPVERINLGEQLLTDGFGEVVRHKQDEEKSGYYDALVAAEASARAAKRGQFSGKPSPEARVTDLCFDGNKAKQYLPFLQREKSLRAIVEQVYAGNRFKIYIPKENCTVNYVLAGIKSPQPARPSKEAEPFGEEARKFSRRTVNQRNVIVEIEDMDRAGNAFGPLYVGQKDSKTNIGCHLLAAGYGRIDDFSIDRTSTASDLVKAQDVAKAGRKNIWKNVLPDETVAAAAAPVVRKTADDVWPVVRLSEIVSHTHFFVQNISDRVVATLEDQMRAWTASVGVDGKTVELRKGALIAALFDDGQGPLWNRARIESVSAQAIRVRFIDYGNVEVLPVTRLRPLDPTLVSLPGQAKECVFGFVKQAEPHHEYAADAAHLFNDLAWGKTLTGIVHGRDEAGRFQVSLFVNDKSVSESLLETGVARVDRKSFKAAQSYQKKVVDGLLTAQDAAKRRRLCLWQYGDVESDDE